MSPTPILLEFHVDEELLRAEPARWDQVAALVERVAGLAEAEGGRLCLRVRERLVTGDSGGFLRGLAQRGHEVGWHCHGDDPEELIAAMRAAGLEATVGTPGMVQAPAARWPDLLARAHALGTRRITDWLSGGPGTPGPGPWAHAGWLPAELQPGLWCFATSIPPWEWGVLRRARPWGRWRHGHGGLRWDQLSAWIVAWDRLGETPGLPPYFSAALHEHNLCREDAMAVIPAEIEALRRWLGEHGARLRRTTDLKLPADMAPPRGRPEGAAGLIRRRIGHLAARARPPELRAHTVGLRTVRYRLWGEPARGSWLVIHGGTSGLDQLLSFVGLTPAQLAARGFQVCCFARGPGDRAPGNPDHLAEARELLRLLSRDGPVGLLSWSGGIVPAAGLAREFPVRCLADAEGPVDRLSLRQPGGRLPLNRWSLTDARWDRAEALPLLQDLPVPYLRLQGADDHVHRGDLAHARRAVAAAGGRLSLFAGSLAGHGAEILDELDRIWGGGA